MDRGEQIAHAYAKHSPKKFWRFRKFLTKNKIISVSLVFQVSNLCSFYQ